MKYLISLCLLTFCSFSQAQSVENGKAVFELWCQSCHAESMAAPATNFLISRYGSLELAAIENREYPAELIRIYVRDGVSLMPHFRETEISTEELEDLIAYLAQ